MSDDKINSQILHELVAASRLPVAERMPALRSIQDKYGEDVVEHPYNLLTREEQLEFYEAGALQIGVSPERALANKIKLLDRSNLVGIGNLPPD
jgi:hypothetical protein